MAVFIAFLVIFLGWTGHSDAAYCICSSGSDAQMQKNIDYACGAGADCTPIIQNGACYNPNTLKDHCNYAVNSYYQKKGQATGSCDFSGTATVSQTSPSAASGCVYPSSPSNAGTSPSTNPSTSPTTANPSTSPTTTTGGTTTTTGGTTTGTPTFGLGPTGSGGITTNTDNIGVALHHNLLTSLAATLLLFGFISLRI